MLLLTVYNCNMGPLKGHFMLHWMVWSHLGLMLTPGLYAILDFHYTIIVAKKKKKKHHINDIIDIFWKNK